RRGQGHGQIRERERTVTELHQPAVIRLRLPVAEVGDFHGKRRRGWDDALVASLTLHGWCSQATALLRGHRQTKKTASREHEQARGQKQAENFFNLQTHISLTSSLVVGGFVAAFFFFQGLFAWVAPFIWRCPSRNLLRHERHVAGRGAER